MNWPKLIADVLGLGFGVYLIMLFYGTFVELKVLKKRYFVIGFLLYICLNLIFVHFFLNQIWLLVLFVALIFLFGFYFKVRLIRQFLLALLFAALTEISEVVVVYSQVYFLGVPREIIQNNILLYSTTMLSSKLIVIVFIYIVRLFFVPKAQEYGSKWFSLIMPILPLQSLLLCVFVAQIYTVTGNDYDSSFLFVVTVLSSIILLVIATFIMRYQLKVMQQRQEYEQAYNLLKAQTEHYNELYSAGSEVRAMRHDMKNELIALSGLLSENKVENALKRITDTGARLKLAENVVDSGFPAIDAVLNSKIKKALEHNANIKHRVIIDSDLHIDQIDVAIILANALDNALEAVIKSNGIDKTINTAVTGKDSYISVIVENHTFDVVDMQLDTTKADKNNHGFGIRQMKMIAEKYDGDLSVEFNKERMVFSLSVLLKNQEAAQK